MSQFITDLDCHLRGGTGRTPIWILDRPLLYYSSYLKKIGKQPQVAVPKDFETDFASVPRVPIAYWFWGGRCHRESVIHDFLYRIDCVPEVSRAEADKVFLEAMEVRQKPWGVRWPMYLGVRLGGGSSYRKRTVADKF